MKSILGTSTLVGLLAFSGPALADTINISGTIDGSEPTFDQPLSTAMLLTSYDTISFTVGADGMYSFLSFYAGDTSLDENMDGTLFLYATSFDPLAPGDSIASDDDYTVGDVAALAAFDGACVGQNCSGFEVALTAGTDYILVQSTFSDAPTTFGQPTGSYDLTITGPGDVAVVPLPAALWLMVSGLLGLGAMRRR